MQALAEGDLGRPFQLFPGQRNIGPALFGVIGRERFKYNLAAGSGKLDHQPGKFHNCELDRITDINGTRGSGEQHLHNALHHIGVITK